MTGRPGITKLFEPVTGLEAQPESHLPVTGLRPAGLITWLALATAATRGKKHAESFDEIAPEKMPQALVIAIDLQMDLARTMARLTPP